MSQEERVPGAPGTSAFSPILSPGRAHLAEADGWRGIAIALVVLYHAIQFRMDATPRTWPRAGSPLEAVALEGHTGVALFFVLSGFLLTLPWANGRPEALGTYFWKRVLRIVPLHYFVVFFSLSFAKGAVTFGNLVPILGFLANTPLDKADLGPFGWPFWSLSTEVQFYVALPFLAAAFPRVRQLSLLVVACLLLKTVSFELPGADGFSAIYFSVFGRIDQFAIGMIVAQLFAKGRLGVPPRLAACLFLGAAAALVGWLAFLNAHGGFYAAGTIQIYWHTVEGALWGLLLALGLCLPQSWKRPLTAAPLRFLGLVSYSMFSWHVPVVFYLATCKLAGSPWAFGPSLAFAVAVGLPAVIAVGALSYYLIERPVLVWRQTAIVARGAA
jgi:peptidoglycan/LPS O-acetylase OafA/YrhL